MNDVCSGGFCAGELLCDGVTCDAPDECRAPGTCDHTTGECNYAVVADGSSCDDGADNTVEDKCTRGVCAGEDKCADVSCDAETDCHNPGQCDKFTGACSVEFKPNGDTCDDASSFTKNDKCDGQGGCAGEKLCVGVVCSAKVQCHEAGICDDLTGECNDPVKAHLAACNDEDDNTVRDVCLVSYDDTGTQNVECKGEDLCAEVTCVAQSQCHEAGECDHLSGSCSNPQSDDGKECDDANAFTESDTCRLGSCMGAAIIACSRHRIEIPEATEAPMSATQPLRETVDFACPENEVISKAKISSFNSHEDITMEFGCSATSSGTEQCEYTATTAATHDFDQECPHGFALAGIQATYTETAEKLEDRRFKMLCCKVKNSIEQVEKDEAACD